MSSQAFVLVSRSFVPGAHRNATNGDMTTDGELTLRLRERDVRALVMFYERHRQIALGVACRVLHESALAEDVVQDAFLTLWRQPERFDPTRGSARNWLLTIVHHRSVDRQRLATLRGNAGELSPNLVDMGAIDPCDVALAAMTRDCLRSALDMLPDAQRQTIELAYVHGRTHAEIAELMNCPLGTVKGRIRIGFEKLRMLVPSGLAMHAN